MSWQVTRRLNRNHSQHLYIVVFLCLKFWDDIVRCIVSSVGLLGEFELIY